MDTVLTPCEIGANNPPVPETTEELIERMRGGEAGNLPEFLTYAGFLGTFKPSTLQSYRSASTQVLKAAGRDVLYTDVRTLDVELCVQRFVEARDDELSDDSLTSYEMRFRRAVYLYRQWLNADIPVERERHLVGRFLRAQEPNQGVVTANLDRLVGAALERQADEQGLVVYPFPLADRRMASVALPNPLSKADADRLCAFIQSLAVEPEEDSTWDVRQSPVKKRPPRPVRREP